MSRIRHSRFATRHWKWAFAVVLLLVAWGLRLCCLEEVPPGWRDDDLINIHALSGQLLEGRFPLYYTDASGHEPLYHHLHAGVHAVLGFNVLSGHILSVAFGTLSVALTYTTARRLFRRPGKDSSLIAVIASLALTTSFWSLMYSRFALRHVSLPPTALATIYVFWRAMDADSGLEPSRAGLLGLLLAASLTTYTAARVLPGLLILFAAYLALFHRDRFRRHWRGMVLALVVMAMLVAPMGIAIARGRSERALEGIGADARLDVLAEPLRELRAGNPRPLLTSIWKTLGMFHATGDPEWLYNVAGRPVFNLLGGALLWAGVALCLYRWRQPRYVFLLLWLGLGLLPAFVSVPPASLSHTILAQPVAYILPALALTEFYRWLQSRFPSFDTRHSPFVIRRSFWVIGHLSIVIFLSTNAVRDLRDYFVTWPRRGMVRFLYRADYREAAQYLNAHPEITDVAISSALLGPWDRLALEVDTKRDDVAVRLFNPDRALIWARGGASSPVILTTWPDPSPPIADLLEMSAEQSEAISPHLTLHTICDSQFIIRHSSFAIRHSPFANGLTLTEARWLREESLTPGREAVLLAGWQVAAPLDLPPMPLVANPPPPDVYPGPRLAVFAHLLDRDGTLLASDDGLGVDPLTLRAGDRFVQLHRFALPPDAPDGPYTVELGLYDPKTGRRWPVLDDEGEPLEDRVIVQ